MQNLDILLSDLKVRIEHSYNYMPTFCKNYLSEFDSPDIVAKTQRDELLKEKEIAPSAPDEVCESLCLYRNIAEQLPAFDRFVLHAGAVEHDGNAYIFTGHSGVGKTTHIKLWKKYLKDSVSIINGDKPIINASDRITVCGTPWAGKEGYHNNISAPLKAICVLKQSSINKITTVAKPDAVDYLMCQVYMPKNPISLSRTLTLMDRVIKSVPVYLLECDISKQAFEISYKTLTY